MYSTLSSPSYMRSGMSGQMVGTHVEVAVAVLIQRQPVLSAVRRRNRSFGRGVRRAWLVVAVRLPDRQGHLSPAVDACRPAVGVIPGHLPAEGPHHGVGAVARNDVAQLHPGLLAASHRSRVNRQCVSPSQKKGVLSGSARSVPARFVHRPRFGTSRLPVKENSAVLQVDTVRMLPASRVAGMTQPYCHVWTGRQIYPDVSRVDAGELFDGHVPGVDDVDPSSHR